MTKREQQEAQAEAWGWTFVPSHDHKYTGEALPECWVHEETHAEVYSLEEIYDPNSKAT
jgi:hypothetical protein